MRSLIRTITLKARSLAWPVLWFALLWGVLTCVFHTLTMVAALGLATLEHRAGVPISTVWVFVGLCAGAGFLATLVIRVIEWSEPAEPWQYDRGASPADFTTPPARRGWAHPMTDAEFAEIFGKAATVQSGPRPCTCREGSAIGRYRHSPACPVHGSHANG